MSSHRLRPWIAAAFAFLYPGLGHVYLRSWLRALVWFALAMVTAWLVVPADVVAAFGQNGLDGLTAATRDLPLATLAPLLVVRALNVVDAYLTAIRQRTQVERDDGEACPECSRPLDDELDFCPWCTTRLEEPDEGEEDAEFVSRQ